MMMENALEVVVERGWERIQFSGGLTTFTPAIKNYIFKQMWKMGPYKSAPIAASRLLRRDVLIRNLQKFTIQKCKCKFLWPQ